MSKNFKNPRIVVIGAGFGGLQAVRTLAKYPVETILIDRNNYHTFTPLLYQVAAAELEPEDIAFPIRSIIRRFHHTHFFMSKVEHVDFENRKVEINGHTVSYDYLILGIGSVTQYFNVPGAAEYTFSLKTIEQAITLRNQILSCFERAIDEQDLEHQRRLLTFVIVGGGATGVEFAGALAELIRGPLRKDFKQLDFRNVRIILLEAADSLIAGFPDRLSAYAQKRLQQMKVNVQMHSPVSEITKKNVRLKNGTVIPTETVIWTAGVYGHPLAQLWQLPTVRNGRVPVLPNLQLVDHPEIFVIGDLVHAEENGFPLPMLASVAVQQGVRAAQNIVRQIKGISSVPFRYRNLGTMVTIGRNSAVASLGKLNITGFSAWIVWLSLHLVKLIGFRNKLFVIINWAWDYFFYERAIRLILPAADSMNSVISTKADIPTRLSQSQIKIEE